MLSLPLALPKNRLKICLVKPERLWVERGMIFHLKSLFKIRQGSKISRVFRHIFEHKRIKIALGGTLLLLVVFTSVFPTQVSALSALTQTGTPSPSDKLIELTTQSGVRVPLENTRITQGYSLFHRAVDLHGIMGGPVYPIMGGKVEAVIFNRFSYGNHIIIDHGSGFKSLYAHLSKVEVFVGEKINTNKIIGRVGHTGRATGDHLHLEVYEDGQQINPQTVLPLK